MARHPGRLVVGPPEQVPNAHGALGRSADVKVWVVADRFRVEAFVWRPYRWTTEQAGGLLDELLGTLKAHTAAAVDDLPPYFLGCVVLSSGTTTRTRR